MWLLHQSYAVIIQGGASDTHIHTQLCYEHMQKGFDLQNKSKLTTAPACELTERGFIRQWPHFAAWFWGLVQDAGVWVRGGGDVSSLIKALILSARRRRIHSLRLIETAPFCVCFTVPWMWLDGWNMLFASAAVRVLFKYAARGTFDTL